MKRLDTFIDLRVTAVFLVIAALAAFGISRWLGIGFWPTMGITVAALLLVGLSTFFDDE